MNRTDPSPRALASAALCAAGLLSACPDSTAFVDTPVRAPQCVATDEPSSWVFATVVSTAPLTVTLMRETFIAGTQLSTLFAPENATLDSVVFDAATLASATSVTLTLTPNTPGAAVTIHSGLLCDGTPRAIDIVADPATFNVSVVARAP